MKKAPNRAYFDEISWFFQKKSYFGFFQFFENVSSDEVEAVAYRRRLLTSLNWNKNLFCILLHMWFSYCIFECGNLISQWSSHNHTNVILNSELHLLMRWLCVFVDSCLRFVRLLFECANGASFFAPGIACFVVAVFLANLLYLNYFEIQVPCCKWRRKHFVSSFQQFIIFWLNSLSCANCVSNCAPNIAKFFVRVFLADLLPAISWWSYLRRVTRWRNFFLFVSK